MISINMNWQSSSAHSLALIIAPFVRRATLDVLECLAYFFNTDTWLVISLITAVKWSWGIFCLFSLQRHCQNKPFVVALCYGSWPCSWNVFTTRAYLQLNIGQLLGLALLYLWDVFFNPWPEYNESVVSDIVESLLTVLHPVENCCGIPWRFHQNFILFWLCYNSFVE